MAQSRRDFIKKTALASRSLTVPSYGFTILKKPELHEQIIGHGDFKYSVHKAWGNLDSNSIPIKNCHEMVMDSKGRLIMVADETKNNIIIYDKSEKVISNHGGAKPKHKRGELQLMLQNTPLFNHCHDVCIDEDKNIYVCQWNANKSYPIKLERI